MANIILPQAKVLDTISNSATMLVEENGEIKRYNVTSLTEDFVSQVDNKPKAGFIYPLATPVVPEGFLLCDGAAYSRTEYSELFAAIGTIYGSGDGSTTFNVPNLATRVPVGTGSGYTLGATGGEEKHTLTVEEMPGHSHTVSIYAGSGSYGGGIVNYSGAAGGGQYGTSFTGGSKSHNNMQPYTVVNYIIATGKNTGVSVADIIAGAQALPLGVEYGGTGATNAAAALENLGGISMELLWENASPQSAFGEQRVTLDVSQFDFFIVKVIATTTMGRYTYNIIKNEGLTQALTGIVGDGTTVCRDMIPSGNNVYFSIGHLCSNNSITDNNTCCIPVEIYGIKGVSA